MTGMTPERLDTIQGLFDHIGYAHAAIQNDEWTEA